MASPIVVFGAFDRHNLGDLLFAHLAQALLPGEELIVAGLAARDLRPFGGHRVHALADVAAALAADKDKRPVRVLQLGGELLTCSAWQAAVMLQRPEQVQPTVAWLGRRPSTRRRWVRDVLGCNDRVPYLFARDALPRVERLVVAGVGGVDLARGPAPMRDEVVAKLRAADAVAVRDARTLAALDAAGVDATPLPDPAVMVARLFGARIGRAGRQGEPAALRDRFADGYLAVQVSAAFGDDATLDILAAQLDAARTTLGLDIVLFRAGAAPWHDDAHVLQRLAARLRGVHVFESLRVWDVCALIGHARAVCASSLHVRIVALAYARPRVSLRPPGEPAQARKLDAFAQTWDAAAGGVVDTQALAATAGRAIAMPEASRRELAQAAAAAWHAAWPALERVLHGARGERAAAAPPRITRAAARPPR